jgi:3-oxoacyl-[acyl-carrier protein] reductase
MFMAAVQARSFTGKVALVTGGSKGIGASIVRRLASDGASVAFTYSHSEGAAHQLVREIEAAGGKALSLKADSASANELRAALIATMRSKSSRLKVSIVPLVRMPALLTKISSVP